METQVKRLWAVLVTAINSLPGKDNTLLQLLENLMVSGLQSRHKTIVNECIVMWNRTFGAAEHLEYSVDLRAALLRIRSITDVLVPGLSEENDIEVVVPRVFKLYHD